MTSSAVTCNIKIKHIGVQLGVMRLGIGLET